MLLEYIPIKEQDADILTKELSIYKSEFHKDMIRVAHNPFLVERECWEMETRNSSLICALIKLWIKFELYSQCNLKLVN